MAKKKYIIPAGWAKARDLWRAPLPGARKPAEKKREVVYTEKPLSFEIDPAAVALGRERDEFHCPVANGVNRSMPPGVLQAVSVGAFVTKLVTAEKVVVYRTPRPLRVALKKFDETGEWDLPTGRYSLSPHPRTLNARQKRTKGDKAPRHRSPHTGVFRNRALPTRFVERINGLLKK